MRAGTGGRWNFRCGATSARTVNGCAACATRGVASCALRLPLCHLVLAVLLIVVADVRHLSQRIQQQRRKCRKIPHVCTYRQWRCTWLIVQSTNLQDLRAVLLLSRRRNAPAATSRRACCTCKQTTTKPCGRTYFFRKRVTVGTKVGGDKSTPCAKIAERASPLPALNEGQSGNPSHSTR